MSHFNGNRNLKVWPPAAPLSDCPPRDGSTAV
jgi:hypothetical protein